MEMMLEQDGREIPPVRKKKFVPKHGGKKLEDYSITPPKSFWEGVRVNVWEDMKQKKSDINVMLLKQLAEETNFPKKSILREVLSDLENGARIGVADACRVSSTSSNAPSAIEHGEEVTDALLEWIEDGYVIGPFDPEDVPFGKKKYLV